MSFSQALRSYLASPHPEFLADWMTEIETHLAHLEQSPVLPPHRHSYREGRDATGLPIPEEPAEMPQSGPTLPVSANVNPGATIGSPATTGSSSARTSSAPQLGPEWAEAVDRIKQPPPNKTAEPTSSTQPADRTTGRSASTDDLLDTAWGIIANAYNGEWALAPVDWRDAAVRWRDKYTNSIRLPSPDSSIHEPPRQEGKGE